VLVFFCTQSRRAGRFAGHTSFADPKEAWLCSGV
jgi:hypothetical protein